MARYESSALVNTRKQLTEECTRIDAGAGGGVELQNNDPFSSLLFNNQWLQNNTHLLPVRFSPDTAFLSPLPRLSQGFYQNVHKAVPLMSLASSKLKAVLH